MITVVLIFLLLIVILTCFAVFRRRLFLYPKSETENLPPAPKPASLFAPTEEELRRFEKEENEKLFAQRREEIRQNLISRAKDEDFGVLSEAKETGDLKLYRELLDLLTERIKLEPSKIEKIATFISENNLPPSKELAETILENWKENPSSGFLPKILHVSVLSDSSENYLNAIETVFDFWRQKKLEKISATQLIALFESHYQLLPTDEKTSGAGFLLKEKLASVRREVSGK
jgi:hypothetical protein